MAATIGGGSSVQPRPEGTHLIRRQHPIALALDTGAGNVRNRIHLDDLVSDREPEQRVQQRAEAVRRNGGATRRDGLHKRARVGALNVAGGLMPPDREHGVCQEASIFLPAPLPGPGVLDQVAFREFSDREGVSLRALRLGGIVPGGGGPEARTGSVPRIGQGSASDTGPVSTGGAAGPGGRAAPSSSCRWVPRAARGRSPLDRSIRAGSQRASRSRRTVPLSCRWSPSCYPRWSLPGHPLYGSGT